MIKKKPTITPADLSPLTKASEIRSMLELVKKTASIYEEKNFDERMDAIDLIEFEIICHIESLLYKATQPSTLIALKHTAEDLKLQLEEIDNKLFNKLRADISTGKYTGEAFKALVNQYVDLSLHNDLETPEYNSLDVFINGLTHLSTMPAQTLELDPEMVYYQKTPAHVIFQLAEQCNFRPDDIFVDLGSGLGQVSILINLLTGITTRGMEFEPSFCQYAADCAANLHLSNVIFTNIDARKADYSTGTVFFMFTPFKGQIMQQVLELLRKQALSRKIRIITYGPCTAQLALQSWLSFTKPAIDHIYSLQVFTS